MRILVIGVVIAFIGSCAQSPIVPQSSDQSQRLKFHSDDQRVIGSAVRYEYLKADPKYAEMVSRYFSVVTPENEMKFDWTEPRRNVFNFDESDEIVEFARAHQIKVRGHNLAWHKSIPTWVTRKNRSPKELESILKNHIFKVVHHFAKKYPGQVVAWDVVNEALDSKNEPRTNTPWAKIGNSPTDYIELAFRWAHEADPNAKLFYNDYGNHDLSARSNAVYRLIKSLKEKGVPIDGVGWEAHLAPWLTPEARDLEKSAKRYRKLGLEVNITELTFNVAPKLLKSPKILAEQSTAFERITHFCAEERSCRSMEVWGFTDRWPEIDFQGWKNSSAFDGNYRPKAPFLALERGLH